MRSRLLTNNKNMSTFLEDCLYEKAEVLIVNDGSKDREAETAKQYDVIMVIVQIKKIYEIHWPTFTIG